MLKRTSLAPFDFYLINTNTWVYEYVGISSGNSLYFYVDKPSLPGNYKVWYEGPNESNMTPGTQLMGEPYTEVTWSSSMIAFTSQSDYETLLTRHEEAYEDHSDNFFITYSTLTDEQLDAQIDIAGFDENLPIRDFEGYFGLTSLRASVVAGEDSYLNGYLEDDPDDDCIVSDEIQRTIMTTSAQFAVGGTTYTAPSESNSALCRIVQRRVSKIENSTNDRRTKIVTEFSGAYLGTHLVSKTKYFKKKSGGGWKKYPAILRAQVGGGLYDNLCGYVNVIGSPYKSAKKRRVFLSNLYIPLTFRQIQTGTMGSSHVSNSDTYFLTINW